jgi:predicted dehydrogenase
MSTPPLRCAVVGVGHLGKWHAAKYAQLPDTELVAVVDSNASTAERDRREVRLRTGIGSPRPARASRCREHRRAHHAALRDRPGLPRRGLPRAGREADHDHHRGGGGAEPARRERGVVLQVGHLERFNVALRRLLEDPLQPRFIESHRLAPFKPRATDVSVVLDLMIHDIDIILDLVKAPLTEIRASGARILTNDIDIANARLEFADGCVANVTSSRVSTKSERRMRIFQPHGYASVDFQNRILVAASHGRRPTRRPGPGDSQRGTDVRRLRRACSPRSRPSSPPSAAKQPVIVDGRAATARARNRHADHRPGPRQPEHHDQAAARTATRKHTKGAEQ